MISQSLIVLELLLKTQGYEPVLIPNGLDALDYVRKESFGAYPS